MLLLLLLLFVLFLLVWLLLLLLLLLLLKLFARIKEKEYPMRLLEGHTIVCMLGTGVVWKNSDM